MKTVSIILLSIFLGACASNPKTVINQKVGQDSTLTVAVSSKDFAKIKSTELAEESRKECFKAVQERHQLSDVAQVAEIVAQAAGKGQNCGAGHNDYLVIKEQEKTKRQGNWLGLGSKALGFYTLGRSSKGGGITVTGEGNQVTTGNNSAATTTDTTTTGLQFEPATISEFSSEPTNTTVNP